MKAAGDYNMKKVASVYREYQAALRKNNALVSYTHLDVYKRQVKM